MAQLKYNIWDNKKGSCYSSEQDPLLLTNKFNGVKFDSVNDKKLVLSVHGVVLEYLGIPRSVLAGL